MPEAPDLEVIKDFLNQRVKGAVVSSARVLRPTVLRSLMGDFTVDVAGREVGEFRRSGKFLLMELSEGRLLVVNPMLTGAFQLCKPSSTIYKRTCFILSLSNDQELRYLDDRQMGKVYYTTGQQLYQVPGFKEQGPDVLHGISFDEFQRLSRPFHGEIKGVLTRGRVIAGIGNAYADEILFAAGISPFRKLRSLGEDELRCLYKKCFTVVTDAIQVLRERMGEEIHIKIRDFLQVHNKGGSPCPRCGHSISQLTANQRITSYCRHCQPGMLVRN